MCGPDPKLPTQQSAPSEVAQLQRAPSSRITSFSGQLISALITEGWKEEAWPFLPHVGTPGSTTYSSVPCWVGGGFGILYHRSAPPSA